MRVKKKRRSSPQLARSVDKDEDNNDWENYFEQLRAFRLEHGHCRVFSGNCCSGLANLANWAREQRIIEQREALLPERKQRLLYIGFRFFPSKYWKVKGVKTAERRRKKGSDGGKSLVATLPSVATITEEEDGGEPNQLSGENLASASAVNNKKVKNDDSEISQESTDKIVNKERQPNNSKPHKTRSKIHKPPKERSIWESYFHQLLLYFTDHGHCQVPPNYEPSPLLHVWIQEQQRLHSVNLLPFERYLSLYELGVAFST